MPCERSSDKVDTINAKRRAARDKCLGNGCSIMQRCKEIAKTILRTNRARQFSAAVNPPAQNQPANKTRAVAGQMHPQVRQERGVLVCGNARSKWLQQVHGAGLRRKITDKSRKQGNARHAKKQNR